MTSEPGPTLGFEDDLCRSFGKNECVSPPGGAAAEMGKRRTLTADKGGPEPCGRCELGQEKHGVREPSRIEYRSQRFEPVDLCAPKEGRPVSRF